MYTSISLALLLILQDSVGKELGFLSSAEYRENIVPAFHCAELQGLFFPAGVERRGRQIF